MEPIRVLIADDEALVRGGFRVLIETEPGMVVVGEAADGATALGVVRTTRPDVVLMDVRMPGMDGIEATRRMVADERLRAVAVVVLTTFDTDQNLFAAIRAGAAGFLLKDAPPDQLRAAVRTVAAGDALLSPGVTRRVLDAVATAPGAPEADRVRGLTDREREVLAEIAAGRSNTEIGAVLSISPATARTYVGRLLAKLHARDRAQLVMIAYESGVARPGGRG